MQEGPRVEKNNVRLRFSFLHVYSIGASILKPEMWADTHWKTIIALYCSEMIKVDLYFTVLKRFPQTAIKRWPI